MTGTGGKDLSSILARCAVGSMTVALLAAGCRTPAPPPAPPPPEARVVSSNVERRDYAGSAACAPCHSEIYDKWKASPMHRMTRLDAADAVQAPFDGSTFHFKGDQVTFEAREGRRYMRVQSEAGGAQLFRVTRVIGGRYREDFTGVEVQSTDAASPPAGDPAAEPVLPASYLLFAKQWRYKGYSVMVKERPHLGKHGAPWRQTCIFCHNTEPYLATVYDDLLGGGRTYQGSVSDRLLPADRLWKAETTDPAALSRALDEELAFLKAPPSPAAATPGEKLDAAVKATWDRFGEAQLVEVGIGCEACHNGAREHTQDPGKLPSFEPRSTYLRMATPSPDPHATPARAGWINHTCARCHTVLFSRYPYTWEGGLRNKPGQVPGGSSVNSGEARDFLLGGCAGALRCTTCHDPHTEDRRADLDRLGTVAGNAVCSSCHPQYAAPAALAAHTHHAPDGDGSACLGCHMPRKNAGLAYALTRYHRIGSPTDAARVEKDRPLECALCHADKSVSELTGLMETWWKKRYDRAALRALYGDDLTVRPLVATLRGKPHEQITAAAVLAERGDRASAGALVPLLSAEIPLVRYWAREALERLLGQPLPVDLDGDASAIQRDAAAFVSRRGPPGR
jgi:predicted CXXCH cytochrome family protein